MKIFSLIVPILAFTISFNSYADNEDINSLTKTFQLELVPESDQSVSEFEISIVETEEDLFAWAQELKKLDDLNEDATEFEIEMHNYISSIMPEFNLYLTGPKALRRTCSAIDSSANANGRASWYGGRFHGRRTANGETFNRNELTAAHRTLPFNSLVEVHYNGRTVRVRINDAGPYHGNRIIDLSEAAAKELGLIAAGVGRVRLVLISCGQN